MTLQALIVSSRVGVAVGSRPVHDTAFKEGGEREHGGNKEERNEVAWAFIRSGGRGHGVTALSSPLHSATLLPNSAPAHSGMAACSQVWLAVAEEA
jgi:hypothetical protein